MLTFDPERHLYFWDGINVPGVTSLLRPIHNFDGVPAGVLEAARRRGTYVHRMTELYDKGELDEDANARVMGGAFVGYLQAWKDFLERYEVEILENEQMGYCSLGFAGQWDRWVRMGARGHAGTALLDIKTSQEASRAWGVQTAAYRRIRSESDPSAALRPRYTAQLFADGTFELLPWNDPNDWSIFEQLLSKHQAEQAIERWKGKTP